MGRQHLPLSKPHLRRLDKPRQRTTEPIGQTTTYHLRTSPLSSPTRKMNGQRKARPKVQPTLNPSRKSGKRQPKRGEGDRMRTQPKRSACERRKRHAGRRSSKPK